MIEFIGCFLGGLLIGFVIGLSLENRIKRSDGVLIIGEDLLKWGLDLFSDVNTISNKKRALFDVEILKRKE